MIIDFADIARETIKYTMDDIAREMMKYIMDDVLNEVQKNKSYVGMIIASRTLDTEEKVKNFYGGKNGKELEDEPWLALLMIFRLELKAEKKSMF